MVEARWLVSYMPYFSKKYQWFILFCKKNIILLVIDDFVALLKRQGLDVKGLVKATPKQDDEEEPQPYIDCSGTLQVLLYNFIIDLLKASRVSM